MAGLEVGSVNVQADSLRVGPKHSTLLKAKQREIQTLLAQKKAEFDHQFELHRRKAEQANITSRKPRQLTTDDDAMSSVRTEQQSELDALRRAYQTRLDELYEGFQREWIRNPQEKSMDYPAPHGMDSRYLAETLGEALRHALAEICEKRPIDPIDYLAHWLRQYAVNVAHAQQEAIEVLKTRLEEEDQLFTTDRKQVLDREKRQVQLEKERRKELFQQRLEHVTSVSSSEQVTDSETESAQKKENKPETEIEQDVSHAQEPTHVISEDGNQEPDDLADKTLYTIEEKDSEAGIGEEN